MGLDSNPSLPWSSKAENLKKKLFKHIALLADIKEFLPVKYHIILFNASIKSILEYGVSVWGSCNAGLLDEIFKVQKRCARFILDAPFLARMQLLFLKLGGYISIKSVLNKDFIVLLFKKILHGRALEYSSEKVCYF